MSVVVEKTKVVEVMNNQFSASALQVISYKDGSSVFISCNRLLGDYIKPECFTTTTVTTTSTTTTTTITTTTTTTHPIVTTTHPPTTSPAQPHVLLFTIILILLFLVIIVLAVVVLAICYSHWARIKKELFKVTSGPPQLDTKEECDPLQVIAIPAPPPPPPPIKMDTLLPQHGAKQTLFTPVWLDEIQNNKIFNKQKSINEDLAGSDNPTKYPLAIHADDTLAIHADDTLAIHADDTLANHDGDDNVSHDAHDKENSRTESDQE